MEEIKKHRPTFSEAYQAMCDLYDLDESGQNNSPEYATAKNIAMAYFEDEYAKRESNKLKLRVNKIKVRVNHEISEENIYDFFDGVFSGAISYWCMGTKIVTEGENKEKTDYTSHRFAQTILSGGVIGFAEDEEETGKKEEYTWHGMLLTDLYEGFQMYFDKHPDASFDPCDWDADFADEVMQFALFGELVYG